MQSIERQAQKKGVKLIHRGRCQFCGSDTQNGVLECFEIFNRLASAFEDDNGPSTFIYADAHCLQHSEVHGTWNNHFHLARQYLILDKSVEWNYSKTPFLSKIMDEYKRSHPEAVIPALPVLERGRFTVTDLAGLEGEELASSLRKWALGVYWSYERYHPMAEAVGDLYLNKYERR